MITSYLQPHTGVLAMTQPHLTSLNSSPATTGCVFLPSGRTGNSIAGFVVFPVVIYTEDHWIKDVPRRGVRAADRMARLEADPLKAEALRGARTRLGELVAGANEGQESLSSLRLRAGLSQAQLANLMGTKQSNISRWEKNISDLRGRTIKKLASVLGVSNEQILALIDVASEEPDGED
ncbi:MULTISPECIES: helix-turn-helix domain-containing protein [unclassified Variovorax]|uniref:helix-turn-helix domain-containing protein n=1 Tax=unclassified Variovorax TaxID=663243 RepID=UPI003F46D860